MLQNISQSLYFSATGVSAVLYVAPSRTMDWYTKKARKQIFGNVECYWELILCYARICCIYAEEGLKDKLTFHTCVNFCVFSHT
jgi:hypothetical protein